MQLKILYTLSTVIADLPKCNDHKTKSKQNYVNSGMWIISRLNEIYTYIKIMWYYK